MKLKFSHFEEISSLERDKFAEIKKEEFRRLLNIVKRRTIATEHQLPGWRRQTRLLAQQLHLEQVASNLLPTCCLVGSNLEASPLSSP